MKIDWRLVFVLVAMLVVIIPAAYASDDGGSPSAGEAATSDDCHDTRLKADSTAKTVMVDNTTFNYYFTDSRLNDNISPGDSLDFKGNFHGNTYQMIIDKPVNIFSSTGDVNISLNSTVTSFFGDDETATFTLTHNASGSNISSLYFYNSQVFLRNVENVTINNITSIVENCQVGSGVGQVSIRDNSSNIIVANSTFKTNYYFTCSLVLAWATNCILQNNHVNCSGTSGNGIYLTTYNVNGLPENGKVPVNNNNTIIGNTVYGIEEPQSVCYAIAIEGADNKVINNTVYYGGEGITTQWVGTGESKSINTTIIGNKLFNGSNLKVPKGGLVTDNYISGTLRTTPGGAVVENNTIAEVDVLTNTTLTHNNILGDVLIAAQRENINITSNTIGGMIHSTGRFISRKDCIRDLLIEDNTICGIIIEGLNNSVIKNNTINGQIIFNGSARTYNNISIEYNSIISEDEYAVYLGRGCNNVTVHDNYLVAVESGGDYAIYMYDNINATIESNTGSSSVNPIRTLTTLNEVVINKLGVVSLDVNVTTIRNANVLSGRVLFSVNGKILRDCLTGKIIYAEIEKGRASLELDATPVWTRNPVVQATYLAHASYLESNSSGVIPYSMLSDGDARIFVDDVRAPAGSRIAINVYGENLEDAKVILKVNGRMVKTDAGKLYAKVSDNNVVFNYSIPESLTNGIYDIKAICIRSNVAVECDSTLSVVEDDSL